MSKAIRVLRGRFGRVALLDMNQPLVEHAHHHCHALIKSFGHDTAFLVNGELRRLTDDAAVLINAWEPHCYAHQAGAPETIILALYIEPAWLSEADQRLFGGSPSRFFTYRQAHVTAHARHLVQTLSGLLLDGGPVDAGELETWLFSLMVAMLDGSGPDLQAGLSRPVSDFRIRRAITYLRANVGSPLAMAQVADQAGLSRPHFYALFRRCTGLSPGIFCNVLRMEEAIRRLTVGGQPLAGLSGDLGFEAQSNFTRFFRQHQGVPPVEFRKAVNLI